MEWATERLKISTIIADLRYLWMEQSMKSNSSYFFALLTTHHSSLIANKQLIQFKKFKIQLGYLWFFVILNVQFCGNDVDDFSDFSVDFTFLNLKSTLKTESFNLFKSPPFVEHASTNWTLSKKQNSVLLEISSNMEKYQQFIFVYWIKEST